ncbi:hypothetical protein [Streptomyces sp. HSG2]|uniref:hypothetical protein n=1 Tax=Streptomyces sp. HSG2 TaxID=2797167 RepID=UPI00190709B1|nr:hypothetical protein [Streptomyces sp. HSG2]
MFTYTWSRRAAVALAAVTTGAVTAGVAVAVADNVRAPYAQAGATVDSKGEIRSAKGVEEVRRLGPGEYCVVFTDPDFHPARVLPSVSALQRARIVNYTWAAGCGAAEHAAKVWTTDHSGAVADSWFSIVVH